MKRLYTFGRMKQLFNAEDENIFLNSLVKGFSIDSRTLKEGDLFFCIKGLNTDGHKYISEAIARGASAIVANQKYIPEELKNKKLPKMLVSDPNEAFVKLASDFRKKFRGKVIAVTGSNGKTTTKEILTNLCRFFDPFTSSTPGNFNNNFGVPITLLTSNLKADWWIVEIGTNNFGEVSYLSQIVKPNSAIITNVGESHLEFLENTEGVAREKSDLFSGMTLGGKIVLPYSILHKEIFENAARKFGLKITKINEVFAESTNGKTRFRLFKNNFETLIKNPLLIQNLILALTILYLEGVPVSKLISATSNLKLNLKGRFNQIMLKDWILVDDTYNANPASFNSVLENLNKLYPLRRKIVVCGAMGELGDLSNHYHSQVGENMVKNGVSFLFCLGGIAIDSYIKGWLSEGGKKEAAKNFGELKNLVESFKKFQKKGDVVLVKGSRSSRMEEFIELVS